MKYREESYKPSNPSKVKLCCSLYCKECGFELANQRLNSIWSPVINPIDGFFGGLWLDKLFSFTLKLSSMLKPAETSSLSIAAPCLLAIPSYIPSLKTIWVIC